MKPNDKVSIVVDYHETRLEGYLVTLETEVQDGEETQIARVRCKTTDKIWRGVKPEPAYFLSPASSSSRLPSTT